MAIKYKIVELNKENLYLSKIQMTGKPIEFTVVQVWDNIKAMRKQMMEVEAKNGVEKAKMQNIIQNYPALVELIMGQITLEEAVVKLGADFKIEEKERVAIDLFERSRRFVRGAEEPLKELKEAIEFDEKNLKAACLATKIPMPMDIKIERAADKKQEEPTQIAKPEGEVPQETPVEAKPQ